MKAGAIPLLLLLLGTQAGAASTIVRTISDAQLDNAVPLGEWTAKPPTLADVNGDGALDILSHNANRHAYALDLRTGALLAEVAPRYPYGPDLGPFNGPRAADLDGDGYMELVVVNRAALVSVWTLRGANGTVEPTLSWERHLDEHHARPSADAGPVLGDLDADGSLEIVVQTEETGVHALRSDGSTLWSLANHGGNAEPRVVDVDRDGDNDVVVFTDGGIVYAAEGRNGSLLWRFDLSTLGVWPGSITSPGVVADIDGDGRVEVVACARNVEGGTPERAPSPLSQHHFALVALRDGALLWHAKPDWGNPLCAAYLMAFDADGDGAMEIYGMDWNTIGHKPGHWERSGTAHVFAFRHDGVELWHRDERPWNAKPNIAAADWTGDGRVDVVAYGASGLSVLDARTGAPLARVDLPGEVVGGPLVADFDGDGDADAVVAVGSELLVIDTRAPLVVGGWPGWDPVPAGTNPPRPLDVAPDPPTPALQAEHIAPSVPETKRAVDAAPLLVLLGTMVVALARRLRA